MKKTLIAALALAVAPSQALTWDGLIRQQIELMFGPKVNGDKSPECLAIVNVTTGVELCKVPKDVNEHKWCEHITAEAICSECAQCDCAWQGPVGLEPARCFEIND